MSKKQQTSPKTLIYCVEGSISTLHSDDSNRKRSLNFTYVSHTQKECNQWKPVYTSECPTWSQWHWTHTGLVPDWSLPPGGGGVLPPLYQPHHSPGEEENRSTYDDHASELLTDQQTSRIEMVCFVDLHQLNWTYMHITPKQICKDPLAMRKTLIFATFQRHFLYQG